MVIVVLLGATALFCILFYIVHNRALSDEEVNALGQKRRGKAIAEYYAFVYGGYSVNPYFKKNMIANGSFYTIDESLMQFPAIAAGLLKYKKHEWIIIAFEKNQRVDKIWINKGLDRSQVQHGINLEHIGEIVQVNDYTTVLTFHNHPNSNPSLYSMIKPSASDLETAAKMTQRLLMDGANLLEFVCERGRHYEYCRSIAKNFLPVETFCDIIKMENGLNGYQNFRLHWELMFK